MALPKLKQTEVIDALEEELGWSKSDIKHFLVTLEELVFATVKAGKRIEIAKVTIEPKLSPARKARMGRNPATGEPVKIKAKPASSKVVARVAKALKEAAPTAKKLDAAIENSKPAPRKTVKQAARKTVKTKARGKTAAKKAAKKTGRR